LENGTIVGLSGEFKLGEIFKTNFKSFAKLIIRSLSSFCLSGAEVFRDQR